MVLEVEHIHNEYITDEVFTNVGLIHALILYADNFLESKQYEPVDRSKEYDLSPRKVTPFGEATISNFTKYFLMNNVKVLRPLKQKLESLKPYLDTLKRDSKSIAEKYSGETYEDLVKYIHQFYISHTNEINNLLKTIEYLNKIDITGPAIFYTYPQWSSTQISDRYIKIDESEKIEKWVYKSAKIVSGLHSGGRATYYNIYFEMESDLADSVDWEYVTHINVPEETAIARTARTALIEQATYYDKIRVCCEFILGEINSLYRGEILENTTFLEMFTNKALEQTRTETTLWDFKKSIPAWHRRDKDLDISFAADVAAYANNRGGLLLIGISDDRDVLGIDDIEDKIKLSRNILERKISNHYSEVKTICLPLKDNTQKTVSCLVILIPQTQDPTSVIKDDKSELHPFRDGVEVKYLLHHEIAEIKNDVYENNFYFAQDLVDFTFLDKLVN